MRPGLVIFLLLIGPLALRAQTPARSGPGASETAALARQVFIRLPPPPEWDHTAPATLWSIEDIQAEFAKVTSTPPQINFVRTQFLQPDHAWMTRFKGWFRSLEKPLKMTYEDQLWDCDNYANCFVAFADLLTLRAGDTRGTFCVGWATVYYERPFAGTRSGAHAVAIVGTSRGLFVIEPQDGSMVSLREFPNRHTIEAVYF
jgi:hypothetical protein